MMKSTIQDTATACDHRTMIEEAHHGVFVHHNFRPLFANKAFARMFGYVMAAEIMELPLIRPLIPHESWAPFEARYDALMRGKVSSGMIRLRMLRRDGSEIWLALTERKVKWQGRDAVEWHAFDISEHMVLEQKLLASEQRLRAILEVLPYPVLIATHDNGQLLFVNRKACLLLAQNATALLKSSIFGFFQDDADRQDFMDMLAAIKEVREQEVRMQAKDGRPFLAEMAAITMDYSGRSAVLLALNDISARKQLENELFHQASTDPLTGISNRRYFIARAEQELRRARRFARPLTVMMLDLDHFKRVNDTHGHAAGDAVLRATVQAVNACLRNTDVIGRLGGEEFAVLMPETDLHAATEVASRLRQEIAALEVPFGGEVICCTVSIGVAMLQPQDGDIDAVLHRADQGLYLAKRDGRNRVVGVE